MQINYYFFVNVSRSVDKHRSAWYINKRPQNNLIETNYRNYKSVDIDFDLRYTNKVADKTAAYTEP